MALILWNDNLSVGVTEFDKQHQRLIGLMNDLNDAMRQGKGNVILGNILNDLIGYAGTHFKEEEKYFDQFEYPEADSHKKDHAAFIARVTAFQGDFNRGKIGLSAEVMKFLTDWLLRHINGVDKKYGDFFNAKGLK